MSTTVTDRRAVQSRQTANLERVADHWQRALDADYRALNAVDGILPHTVIAPRLYDLARERHDAELLLARLAQTTGIRPAPWLAAQPVTHKALGLPDKVEACIFDLDGVLTDSGVVHAWAWAETFDPLLLRLSEKTGWQFVPFDRDADYRAFVDGRPRLEGVHTFLASRGIRLPEGRPEDTAQAQTAYGLAKRKSELLAHALQIRGVAALDGARRYLEAAGRAALPRAVISASTKTLPMLRLAGLDILVEERVDAEAIQSEGLRARPAPDLLLAACRRLDVPPEVAVTFTHTAAGIAAGHAAGMRVVGVAEDGQSDVLRGFGAEHVVESLDVLLDRHIFAAH
jgi:beta-phosphoglucomutase-like phosphatase (HAD superfamily)